MSFHTLLFGAFLAIVVVAYYPVGKRRLPLLGLANAVFYGFAGLPHLTLFVGVSAVTYWCSHRRHRGWLWLGIAVNLANLGFFKYAGFFASGLEQRLAGIALPIGISFYTFQMISYLVDVMRGQLHPSRSWLEFWVYVSFFAQLIAGPIMRGRELLGQIRRVGHVSWDRARHEAGLRLVLIGLGKKLVLADTLAPIVERLFSQGPALSSAEAWLAAYLFGFQIYYDFSAYSDIALGIGRLLGIRLARNFDTPYLSASPREFWRRWHITLSSWIRDYIYIPLGGSRQSLTRSCLALMAAMGLSGLWHGAAWTFVYWGLFHGLLVCLHRLWSQLMRRIGRDAAKSRLWSRPVGVALTFHLVTWGWVLFRAGDLASAIGMMRAMALWTSPGMPPRAAAYAAILGLLFSLHVAEQWALANHDRLLVGWRALPAPVRGACWAVAVLVLLAFTRPEASSFIYFRF